MRRKHLGFAIVLTALIGSILPACRDSQDDQKVDYEEISEKDTTLAMRKAFVNSTGELAAKDVPPGVDRFFTMLGRASRSEDTVDPEKFFTLKGMLSSLESSGAFDGFSASKKKGFRSGFQRSLHQFSLTIKQLGVDDHKVQLVEELDSNKLLVYVRMYDNELLAVTQMRWWLMETDDGWRAYDFEDLTTGLRTVNLMSLAMRGAGAGKMEPWVAEFTSIVTEMNQSADLNDPESIIAFKSPLIELRKNTLPNEIKTFASMLMVSVFTLKEDYEAALAELEEAQNGGYASPLWHYQRGGVLSGLERDQEALECYEKHIAKLGADSDVMELISTSHLALDNIEEANEAALIGLKDNPFSTGCLAMLAASSSPEKIVEEQFVKRFLKMPDPEEAFEITLDYLLEFDDLSRSRILFEVFKEKFPSSDLLEYYEDEFQQE